MAKLYFYYSSMNAGKSTALLQSSYNYKERGMRTVVLAPDLDDRYGVGKVTSRIGIEADAITFKPDDDLYAIVAANLESEPLHCVLIDEAHLRDVDILVGARSILLRGALIYWSSSDYDSPLAVVSLKL